MAKAPSRRRVKLLVAIINKEDQPKLGDVLTENCVSVNFSGLGYGTARQSYLSYLGINEIRKIIVQSLIPDSAEKRLMNAINKALRLYLPGRGIAFTLPISGISSVLETAVLSGPEPTEKKPAQTKKEANLMHELVIAVVEQKFSDDAINAARAAGATGATVFHTRSFANEKAEQSMGATLPKDTDTLFFLTTEEFKIRIMEAVRDAAGLKTEGGASIFSIAVDELAGIGNIEEEES